MSQTLSNNNAIQVFDSNSDEELAVSPAPSFYGCYLLQSLSPKSRVKTYIGFTQDPFHRIRQHNGLITGGAKRTSRQRPVALVLVVYGFRDRRRALQFEWHWQHPQFSRHVCDRTAGTVAGGTLGLAPGIGHVRATNLNQTNALRLLAYLLRVEPFKDFDLRLYSPAPLHLVLRHCGNESLFRPREDVELELGRVMAEAADAIATCWLCAGLIKSPQLHCKCSGCSFAFHGICFSSACKDKEIERLGTKLMPWNENGVVFKCPYCGRRISYKFDGSGSASTSSAPDSPSRKKRKATRIRTPEKPQLKSSRTTLTPELAAAQLSMNAASETPTKMSDPVSSLPSTIKRLQATAAFSGCPDTPIQGSTGGLIHDLTSPFEGEDLSGSGDDLMLVSESFPERFESSVIDLCDN